MSSADWLLVSWWCQWSRDSFSATPCDMTRNKPSECWHKKCTYITQVHIKSTSRDHISAPLVDPYCHKTGFVRSDYVMMTSWCCNVRTFEWHLIVCVTNFGDIISYRENDSNFWWSPMTIWSVVTFTAWTQFGSENRGRKFRCDQPRLRFLRLQPYQNEPFWLQ